MAPSSWTTSSKGLGRRLRLQPRRRRPPAAGRHGGQHEHDDRRRASEPPAPPGGKGGQAGGRHRNPESPPTRGVPGGQAGLGGASDGGQLLLQGLLGALQAFGDHRGRGGRRHAGLPGGGVGQVAWWLWPMPVITGTGAVAIALTTGALSKGLSWASSPPPRTTSTAWLPTPAARIWAAMRAGAASPSSGAGKCVAATWKPLWASTAMRLLLGAAVEHALQGTDRVQAVGLRGGPSPHRALTGSLLQHVASMKQGPFPLAGLCCPAPSSGTTTPSDSLVAARHSPVVAGYRRARFPDPAARGHRGPLQFPRHPSGHSTPPTPEGSWAPAPGSQVPSMAFATAGVPGTARAASAGGHLILQESSRLNR
jgi:hypothetical protein